MSLIFKVKAKIKGILSKYTSLSITGTTSNIKIDEDSGIVYKEVMMYNDCQIIENEIKWLELLSDTGFTPQFIAIKKNIIQMTYIGENLTKKNLPKDWESQLKNISEILNHYNCNHNDIKISDILVKDGKLGLIDFQWATLNNQKIPDNWPFFLLTNKKKYDNFEALMKAIKTL